MHRRRRAARPRPQRMGQRCEVEAILRELQHADYPNLLVRTSQELNLRDRTTTRAFFEKERPQVVVLAAAKVGGIKANNDFPVEFLLWNLQIQNNVIEAAADFGAA